MGVFTNALGTGGNGQTAIGIYRNMFTASWLYRKQLFTHTGSGWANWAAIEGESGMLTAASRWLGMNPGGTVCLMQCMLPTDDGDPATVASLARGASGAFDSHFVTMANRLISKGLANNVIVRIGHEFNGTWYPWKVLNATDAANYAAYYRRIVNAIRSVPGTENIKFEWCGINFNQTTYPISAAYPGDEYVDYIGVDIYDACYAANTYPYPAGSTPAQILTRQQTAWANLSANWGNGLAVWKNFAASRGKPFTLPEWGISTRPDGHGGGDNPYFIQKMYDFIQNPANNVFYHSYWDVDVSDSHSRLSTNPASTPTEFPNSAALFRRLFGIPPFPLNNEIGTTGVLGKGAVVTVTGAGSGYRSGETSDNFHLSSRLTNGDDVLTVKIVSATGDTTSQCGVMLRGDVSVSSSYAALVISGGAVSFQSRSSAGTAAVQHAVISGATFPRWLKLEREGNLISGYQSPDGLNWSFVAARTVVVPAVAHLGVAVGSGNTTALNTVAIDNVDNVDIDVTSTSLLSGAIVVDNSDTANMSLLGPWVAGTNPADFNGTNFLTDNNANKGQCSARFTPTIPSAKRYDVYARWPACYNRADYVPVDISSADGLAELAVNQVIGRNVWNYLGTYNFAAGTTGSVTFSNEATAGHAIADAVMLVPKAAAWAPMFTLFQDPTNNIAWTAGYGSVSGSVVGTDNGQAPMEGATQYKLSYTSGSVGHRLSFNAQNLSSSTHLRIARKGPLANSGHSIGLRLVMVDGTLGGYYTLPRTTTYQSVDIALTSLGAGISLSQISGIMLYPTSTIAGQSDTVYLDSISFVRKY